MGVHPPVPICRMKLRTSNVCYYFNFQLHPPPKGTKAEAREGPRKSLYGMARQYIQSTGKSLTPSLGIREPSDRPRVGLPLAPALAALGPMRVGPARTQEPVDAGSQGVGGRGGRRWCNAALRKVDACGRGIKGEPPRKRDVQAKRGVAVDPSVPSSRGRPAGAWFS